MGNVWESNRDHTRFGNWCINEEITQGDIKRWSGVSRPVIMKMYGDANYRPSELTKRSVLSGLQQNGYNIEEGKFW